MLYCKRIPTVPNNPLELPSTLLTLSETPFFIKRLEIQSHEGAFLLAWNLFIIFCVYSGGNPGQMLHGGAGVKTENPLIPSQMPWMCHSDTLTLTQTPLSSMCHSDTRTLTQTPLSSRLLLHSKSKNLEHLTQKLQKNTEEETLLGHFHPICTLAERLCSATLHCRANTGP